MDLNTRYLGLRLPSPLVASASPLNLDLGNLRQLEDGGAGAVVLPSIFEEQIEHEDELLEAMEGLGAHSHAEAAGFFPPQAAYRLGPQPYLQLIQRARAALDIPVIASLNAVSSHGWSGYAQQIEAAGASALELNIYYIAADPEHYGRAVEQRYLDVLTTVRRAVRIPVAVKLSPYFSAMSHMATELVRAGADGLVLFNRFYEPDIDLTRLRLTHDLQLSQPSEIRLPLLWIGVLCGRLLTSLAASTGVESRDEVVKYLLAGADVVMTTSALLRHGVGHMRVLHDGLVQWLQARGLDSLERIRGSLSQRRIADPSAFERANYVRILQGYPGTG